MSTNDISSVKARLEALKDLKDSLKERFLGLLGIRQPKAPLEDEPEVYLQVGRTVWHSPRQLRIELWLSSLARRHNLVSEYHTYLAKDITREASVDIEKDVQRTFPNTRRFKAEEGQAQLRNVLRAYAAYDPEVAYCQGMNFLTGLLLMHMPTEAHAFAALIVLMEDRKLRSFYHRSMALLQVQLWQLSRLISPSLNQHLEGLGVVPMLYGASWLMTAFSADFPIPFSARIMDVLLADQCECALLKVATAIMKVVEPRLKAMSDLEDVLGYLKIEVPAWDDTELHGLLTAAFTKPWTSRQLAVLRSTEGAETVAQAMDRVMTMNEQLTAQVSCEEEEITEDGEHQEPRVSAIPRLNPPPQPAHSFATSPACGTPITGGGLALGMGSCGGAGSPPASAPSSARCHAMHQGNSYGGPSTSTSCGGAVGGAPSGSTGGDVGGICSGPAGANGMSQSGASSPAVWGIPCIHPNVPASPAIQAFRRAHFNSFQAAVAAIGSTRNGRLIPFQHGRHPHSAGSGASEGGCVLEEGEEVDLERDIVHNDKLAKSSSPNNDGNPSLAEEWGEFNAAAAARQQWRSVMRSAPGSTRHVLLHPIAASCGTAEGDMTPREGPWCGSGPCSGAIPNGGASSTPTQDVQSGANGSSRASQPIPVPGTSGFAAISRTGTGSGSGSSGIISAFANPSPASAAAGSGASTGKPPLPPRCSSFDRGPQLFAPGSRLSVVTEDPLAVQMGPAAPAPSPRGSMDLHVALGRSGSQPLEAYEQYGLLLYGTTAAGGAAVSNASCNGEFPSGSASGTTAGVITSPSGVSGGVSPHPTSPRLPLSSWAACSSGVGATPGDGHGGVTPNAVYTLLGMDRTVSGSLHDGVNAGGGAVFSLIDRSTGPTSPLALPQLPTHQPSRPQAAPPQQVTDMATDIAGDILRMLSAVDTGNANAAYDPRAVLGESMYADSPNKEKTELVRRGSESHLRHLPSSSMLAEAAQDLARAQEQAERVRQELEAQLQQQRAAERNSIAAPDTARSVETLLLPQPNDAAHSNPNADPPIAPEATEAMAASAPARAETVENVAPEASGTNTVPAAAGPAAGGGSVAGSERAGVVEELVFKRPTRYVDGIPMFDPKSLMVDSSEAQVMFTPVVSPGASSYADSHVPGFTPTAEPATPVDRDVPDASEPGVPTSEACPLLREDVADEAADAQLMVALTKEAEAEGYTAAAAEADGDDGIEYPCISGVSMQEALGTVSQPQGAASPSPSEWVDWSQAPPLQIHPAMVVPPIQEVIEVTATTMTAQIRAPTKPSDVAGSEGPHVRTDDMAGHADEAHLEEAPTLSAEISLPFVIEYPRDTLLGENLIDMASPVRPLPPCASARVDGHGNSVSFSPLTSYGTGLSPVAVRSTTDLRHATPRLLKEDSCHEDFVADIYGLLPMASTTSSNTISVTTTTGRIEGASRLSAMTKDSADMAAFPVGHALITGSRVWEGSPVASERKGDDGGEPALPTALGVMSPLAPEPNAGSTVHTPTGSEQQRHKTFEVYPTSIASAVAGGEHLEVGRSRDDIHTGRETGTGSEVRQGAAAASTADLLWLAAQKVEGKQLGIGTDAVAAVHGLLAPSHLDELVQDAHSRQYQLPTPSDTEDAVSDGRSDRGTEAGLSGVQTPPEQETSCMGGIGDGDASDVGEVENSPFRIALSPSLANHIMSVYSRSEVHQREQEKREAEERLQREIEERQRREAEERLLWEQELQQKQPRAGVGQLQESEQLVVRSAATSSRDSTVFESAVSALSGMSMPASSLQPSGTVGVVASASDVVAIAAAPSLATAGPSCGEGLGEAMHSCSLVQTAAEDTGLSTKLVPMPVASAPRLGSGLVSPVLDSPGRTGYSAASLSFGAGSQCVNTAAVTGTSAAYQHAKPQTPFAMTLDDPTAVRMSAEVLAALSPSPPLALLHSERSVLHSAAASFLVPMTTVGLDAQLSAAGSARGSLRCTGSGEGDPVPTTGATSSGPTSTGGSNTLLGFGSGQSKSSGGALHLDLVSYGTHDSSTGGYPPTPGGTRVAMTSSNGGAVPPLLPPPPPPQVPLCPSVVLSGATATITAPVLQQQLVVPSPSCGSTATVNAGVSAATAAAASTPVIATAMAVPLIPAVGPAWTATFDGVEDSLNHGATVEKGCDAEVDECCAQPRHLTSAFAAEARDVLSPTLPVPDSCGASTTTTGINTPEARLHTPDMARGMSIEAAQLPSAPSPAPQMQL